MTENAPTVAALPSSAPTVAAKAPEVKLDAREQLFRELVETLKKGQEVQSQYLEQQAQLLKEHTQAVMANTRIMEHLYDAICGEEPTAENPQGTDGLMDLMATLDETMENVDTRVTGLNMLLSRYSWVFDRLSEITSGSTEAPELEAGKEPEFGKAYRGGRAPVFRDMVSAIKEFDETAEKEALAELDEEEKKAKEDADARAKFAAAPAAPGKPSMIVNKKAPAVFRPLPPASAK